MKKTVSKSSVNPRHSKNIEQVKQPLSIKIYFADNGELRDQIIKDAKELGISSSQLAMMYLKAGRPLVRNTFQVMNEKVQIMAEELTKN